jgi:hypothetical protein
MYKVVKKDGKTFVIDVNEKVVYASQNDGYLIYKLSGSDKVVVEKVSDMTDQALLMGLANAVKL